MKKISNELLDVYVSILEEAYGKNVYRFIHDIVLDEDENSPKNREDLLKFAHRDITYNAQEGNVKNITKEFVEELANTYIGMLGCYDYILDKSRAYSVTKVLLDTGSGPEEWEYIGDKYDEQYIIQDAKENGYKIIKFL